MCPYCGYNNPDEAMFCGRCGKPLQQTIPVQQPIQQPQPI